MKPGMCLKKNLLVGATFLRFSIFFRGSWVGAAMKRPPSHKKRLGGRRPPSISALDIFRGKFRDRGL